MTSGRTSLLSRHAYNSAEHESLRAVIRSMIVRFGTDDAYRRMNGVLNYMGARYASDLSPSGANYCRKHLEWMLPDVAI